jgi:hypothetical protein
MAVPPANSSPTGLLAGRRVVSGNCFQRAQVLQQACQCWRALSLRLIVSLRCGCRNPLDHSCCDRFLHVLILALLHSPLQGTAV